jgi:phenylacetate-coenzyme A ligase PaaK-like adenylate-forming protein
MPSFALYLIIDAYNSYGLSEMNGPGVSFECPCKDGVHIWEDSFILEIIDPEGDEPVPAGTIPVSEVEKAKRVIDNRTL